MKLYGVYGVRTEDALACSVLADGLLALKLCGWQMASTLASLLAQSEDDTTICSDHDRPAVSDRIWEAVLVPYQDH